MSTKTVCIRVEEELWDEWIGKIRKKYRRKNVIGVNVDRLIKKDLEDVGQTHNNQTFNDGGTLTIQTHHKTETLPLTPKPAFLDGDFCPRCLRKGMEVKLGDAYYSNQVGGKIRVCPKCQYSVKSEKQPYKQVAQKNYKLRKDALFDEFLRSKHSLSMGHILALFDSWGFPVTPRRLMESYITPLLKGGQIIRVGRDKWTYRDNVGTLL